MVKSVFKKSSTQNLTSDYERLKHKITNYGLLIVLFIIFFDKAIILLVLYIISIFKNHKKNHKEDFTTRLDYTNFDTSYNKPSYNQLYSHVFNNPELNLKSYNNVAINPAKPLFDHNKFLPECCLYNSEYSTSKGCACITPTQQEYLRRRGTNKSESSFIQNNSNYTNLFFSPTLSIQGDPIPFNNNNTNYIVDYNPLTSQKKSEFNNLTNKIDNAPINYNPSSEVII